MKEAYRRVAEGGGDAVKSLRSPQHMALIEELRRVRKEASLTQAALADKLGVAQSFVAKVEGAERRLDVVEFMQWLRACDATEKYRLILDRLIQMGDDISFVDS